MAYIDLLINSLSRTSLNIYLKAHSSDIEISNSRCSVKSLSLFKVALRHLKYLALRFS
jgi:hypothetical protein